MHKFRVIQGARDKLELEMMRILLTEHDEQGYQKFEKIIQRLEGKGKLKVVKR